MFSILIAIIECSGQACKNHPKFLSHGISFLSGLYCPGKYNSCYTGRMYNRASGNIKLYFT